MKKKALRKDFRVEVSHTLNRFFSIFLIVAMGVAFFSGIQATAPDMKLTGDEWFDCQNLMDIRIAGTLGLTEEDVGIIRGMEEIAWAEGAYMQDVLCREALEQNVLRFESIPERLNILNVEEGALPRTDSECVLDIDYARSYGYHPGDVLIIRKEKEEEENSLRFSSFTISGLVSSPAYIAFERGSTQMGDGKLSGFAYVLPRAFDTEVFALIYSSVDGAKEMDAYSDAYTQTVQDVVDKIERLSPDRCTLRYEEVQKEGQEELERGRQEVAEGEEKLSDARTELSRAESEADEELSEALVKLEESQEELEEGKEQLESEKYRLRDIRKVLEDNSWINASAMLARQLQEQIEEGETLLSDGERELADGWKKYEDGKAEAEEKIADAREQIRTAQQELDDAKNTLKEGEETLASLRRPTWYVSGRDGLADHASLGENAQRMKRIGDVFPVLFFLVAALISLTTMTRMVEEQRIQIGTLKALGYGTWDIASKYLKYAFFATAGGSLLGTVVGEKLIPWVIIHAYGIMYRHMPFIRTPLRWSLGGMAALFALVCTVGATVSACLNALQSVPAQLMRPPAPVTGRQTILERISVIWKYLSFSWKSSVRNLLRYKKRFFMTLFGIGGCMGLLLFAFGLRDSIMDVAVLQFDELQLYDAFLLLDPDASGQDRKSVLNGVAADDRIDDSLLCYMKAEDILAGSGTGKSWSAYILVPESTQGIESFYQFRDRKTHAHYALRPGEVLVTEKLASLLGVKAGDQIRVRREEKEPVTIPVSKICENYLHHYLYMDAETYRALFGEAPDYNTILLNADRSDRESLITQAGTEFLKWDAVVNITYTDALAVQLNRMLKALDAVMWVLIISAGLLAFVVLYNLNNINISERRRELATIRVLGFYDIELAAYVYRENVILTFLGAAAGLGFGIVLHRFIIQTVEIDACMFGRVVKLPSMLYAVGLTFFFSFLVNAVMYFRLRSIDMVESLKSVE